MGLVPSAPPEAALSQCLKQAHGIKIRDRRKSGKSGKSGGKSGTDGGEIRRNQGQTGLTLFSFPNLGMADRLMSSSCARKCDVSDIFFGMARFPRVVAVEVPHHVTQRGNARQIIFTSDTDRLVYMALLREYGPLYGLSLLGYCLMSNHVHLIAVPHTEAALSQCLKQAHGRYASYWNGQKSSTGHVWQGRFYSCPLDGRHMWEALRYVEVNPVRARMVEKAEQWPWSSAAAHCGFASPEPSLEMERWRKRWTAGEWHAFLARSESATELVALRSFTHTGRPLGSEEFVRGLEASMLRPLAARKRGRPKRVAPDLLQLSHSAVA
jgi:putative transposase